MAEPIRTPGVAIDPPDRVQAPHVRPEDDADAALRRAGSRSSSARRR